MLVLLAAVVTGAVAQTTYKVSVKEGTEDANKWEIAPDEATTTGVAAGTEVKATYGGTKKVKSVKAVKKAASLIVNPVVGQIIGSDGKNYNANATLPDGVTAVAKIVYVGSDNGEDAPYNHGLALAMSDAGGGSTCKWKTSKTDAGHTKQTSSTFTEESGLQYNDATHNSDTYPAFKAAIANNGTAAPTGCSAWFLASGYQWTKMFAGDAGGLKTLAGLQDDIYWSSTEYDANKAWRYSFASFMSGWRSSDKNSVYRVRACLAF